ncbi:MAG: hypothetical protein ACFFCQ_00705 [Promethearchaeota archaeon]
MAWNPDETCYVCTTCGTQQEALKTWKKSARIRKNRREQKIEEEREWVLDILGIKKEEEDSDKEKDPLEREWADLIEKSQDYKPDKPKSDQED